MTAHTMGYTLKALLVMARERLGPKAQGLKTKAELLAALGLQVPAPVALDAPLVTQDFFVGRRSS